MVAQASQGTSRMDAERPIASSEAAGRAGWLALAALLATFAAAASTPVADLDYWWHIASGRWIVEHWALPNSDPFGVFGDDDPVRSLTVLRGQWLGQVLLYLAHHAQGAAGAIAVRVVALSTALAAVALRSRRSGAPWASTLLVTGVVAFGLLGYTGERPQLFAFPAFGLLLLLIESADRRRPWVNGAAVAALGLAWANLHGSVLLGAALLVGMAGVEALLRLQGRPPGPGRALWPYAALLCAATLVAPNGLRSFAYVLHTQSSVLAQRTTEYTSSLTAWRLGGLGVQLGILVAFLLAALVLLPLARRWPARAAAMLALAAASALSYRYHAFFLLGAGPWIAEILGAHEERVLGRIGRPAATLAAVAALSSGLLFVRSPPLQAIHGAIAPGRFPLPASDHLEAARAEGRALVWFAWSGYVLWRNGPRLVPFLDPRMLDEAKLRPYTHMIWATPEGLDALDRSGVEWVLLPFRSNAGEAYPLHAVLRMSPGWRVELTWELGALYRRVR